jgi:hypothetical protein
MTAKPGLPLTWDLDMQPVFSTGLAGILPASAAPVSYRYFAFGKRFHKDSTLCVLQGNQVLAEELGGHLSHSYAGAYYDDVLIDRQSGQQGQSGQTAFDHKNRQDNTTAAPQGKAKRAIMIAIMIFSLTSCKDPLTLGQVLNSYTANYDFFDPNSLNHVDAREAIEFRGFYEKLINGERATVNGLAIQPCSDPSFSSTLILERKNKSIYVFYLRKKLNLGN